jgi:hypothetical protein
MRSAPVLATILVAVGPTAAADTVDVNVDVNVDVTTTPTEPMIVEPVIVEPGPPLLRGHRLEGSVMVEGGAMPAIGDLHGGMFGARASLGMQLGRLRLSGEYGFASYWASRDLYTDDGWWMGWEDVGGQVHRFGAVARLRGSVGVDPTSGASVGGYVEGGVGRQRILWNGGGELERNDIVLGLGFEIAGGRQRFGGFDLGVRVLAVPKASGTVPGCAATCTRASEDRTLDLGIVVGLGAVFG